MKEVDKTTVNLLMRQNFNFYYWWNHFLFHENRVSFKKKLKFSFDWIWGSQIIKHCSSVIALLIFFFFKKKDEQFYNHSRIFTFRDNTHFNLYKKHGFVHFNFYFSKFFKKAWICLLLKQKVNKWLTLSGGINILKSFAIHINRTCIWILDFHSRQDLQSGKESQFSECPLTLGTEKEKYNCKRYGYGWINLSDLSFISTWDKDKNK